MPQTNDAAARNRQQKTGNVRPLDVTFTMDAKTTHTTYKKHTIAIKCVPCIQNTMGYISGTIRTHFSVWTPNEHYAH